MAIMNFLRARPQKEPVLREVFLFLINGFLATLVHFATLILFVNFAGLSYGASNFLSFLVGSISSFLGNGCIIKQEFGNLLTISFVI